VKTFAAAGAVVLLASLSAAGRQAPEQAPGLAERLGGEVRSVSLDPEACFRARDLHFQRGDARIYLTEGWLIFAQVLEHGAQPGTRRIGAVFVAAESGDDGEILLRPPDRSNRASLAEATGSPNLNEHFSMAVLLFTDRTAEELLEQIHRGEPKKSLEMGQVLAGRHESLLRNMASSFQVRIVLDLLAGRAERGFFFAAMAGKQLGNFDLLHEPLSVEDITAGRVNSSGPRPSFETWASFESRAARRGRPGPLESDAVLDNYRIEATLRPDLNMEVVTKASIRANRRLEGAIGFELAPQMILGEVRLDGRVVETFRRDSFRDTLMRRVTNDPFVIVLPRPIEKGAVHEVEFRHHGRVVQPAGNNVYFVAARTNWYPMHGGSFAHHQMDFRVPKDLTVVSAGEAVEDRQEGEWRVVRYRSGTPIRVAGFNIGQYEKASVKRGDLEVVVYGNRAAEPALQDRSLYMILLPQWWTARTGQRRSGEVIAMASPVPPNPLARLSSLATEMAGAMEWMSAHFGPPPLKTLTVSPIPGYFGQGFPGLVYLSTVSFLVERDRPAHLRTASQITFYNDILHAHEAAHQWWGNVVTAESTKEEWLQEALANYSAMLLLEKRKGARALDAVLDDYRNSLRAPRAEGRTVESAGPVTWGHRLHSGAAPDPWRPIVYDKGSWIMHMLRRRMGDARFLEMLGELRKRFEYQMLTTEQFRAHCAKFLPAGQPDPDLAVFFDTWVYGTGIPELELRTALRGKAPALRLTVEVHQSGVEEDFSADVPVEIRFGPGVPPIVRWVRTGPEAAVFNINLKRAPARVELAPGNDVLAIRK
jgi:hypothetical protein